MFISSIEAKNFRNYKKVSVQLNPFINFFLGDNGQGKTSLIEALYCALRGKSFKPLIKHQFIKEGESTSLIFLKIQEEVGESSIKVQFVRNGESLERQIYYCGKKVSPSFLYKKFPLLVFTEEKMKSIRGSAEERRSLIDDILIAEGEGQAVSRFKKILREKNRLLRQYKKEEISYKEMASLLEVLNEQFLSISFDLTKKRLKSLERLFKGLEDINPQFFPKDKIGLGFSYLISGKEIQPDEQNIYEILSQSLNSKKDIEIKTGACLSGPQKHEIKMLFNGQDSRLYCSQGQQRIFMLAILASQIKSMKNAVFFLDDVLMELDPGCEQRFLKFLEKIEAQSLVTNCKKTQINSKKMSSFLVKNAIIKPYKKD